MVDFVGLLMSFLSVQQRRIKKEIVGVRGMHCASCASVIARIAKKMSGVVECDVNVATQQMVIEYDSLKTSLDSIDKHLRRLGYALILDASDISSIEKNQEKEMISMRRNVLFSFPIALLVFFLMIWDMLHALFSFVPMNPLPPLFLNVCLFVFATYFLIYFGAPYIYAILRFFQYRVANMDTLIGLGTITAYWYSVYLLLFSLSSFNTHNASHAYFDVPIVVIGFVTVGKYLEMRSRRITTEAIKKLVALQSKSAIVKRGNKEQHVDISDVHVNDIVVVKPGARVPVDGVIIEGSSSIDESMITGEYIPVDKRAGDSVIGGTINKQGYLLIRATKVGQDTMLSHIIQMVREAQGSKIHIQRFVDRVSSVFVPVAFFIACAAGIVWLFAGSASYAILAFVGVLVIACPCALGLATPIAIVVGIGKGAQHGILIRNAESLEKFQNVDVLLLDKTGTITTGKPEVKEYRAISRDIDDQTILAISASLEQYSDHPLGKAIVEKAKKQSMSLKTIRDIQEKEGVGIEGHLEDGKLAKLRRPHQKDRKQKIIHEWERMGRTVVILDINDESVGIIGISDAIKESARSIISSFVVEGVTPMLVTGDNSVSAEIVGREIGIPMVKANVFPKEKKDIVLSLQAEGKVVAMVGDGINDAPALAQADVGIAMANGSDIAIYSADITIMKGDIAKVFQAFRLSQATMKTIKQNLFLAFIYNTIGIPVAAGALYPLLGIFLNPMFAGFAMAVSSISVVGNSILLKRVKLS